MESQSFSDDLGRAGALVAAGELDAAEEVLNGLTLPEGDLDALRHRAHLQADIAEARSDAPAAARVLTDLVALQQSQADYPWPEDLLRLAGYFSRNAPEKADALIDKASAISREHYPAGHPVPAMVFAERARLANIRGELDEAAAFFEKSLNLLQKADDSGDFNRLRPTYLMELAAVNAKLLNYEGTFAASQEALQLLTDIPAAFTEIADVKLRTADHYRHFGQLQQALTLYRELLIHAEEDAPESLWVPQMYNRIGLILEQERQYPEAMKAFLTAFTLMKDRTDDLNDLRWTAERIEAVRWAYSRLQGDGGAA